MTTKQFAPEDFAGIFQQEKTKELYSNLDSKAIIPPIDETPGSYIRKNLCSKVVVRRQVEVIVQDGSREMIEVDFVVLPVREVQRMRENALSRLKSAMKNSGDSMQIKEQTDAMISDEISIEAVYKSAYEPGKDLQIFPNLEEVGKLSSGNLVSFAKNFWEVQSSYSVSRVQMTKEDCEFWEQYIIEGLRDGGNIDFFFLSLSPKAMQDFVKYMANHLYNSRNPSNS